MPRMPADFPRIGSSGWGCREEQQHARWVESLQARIEEDPAGLIADRFPVPTIEHSLAYVNRLAENADSSSLKRINALSVALDLERSLLEHKYFEVLAGDSPQVRRTLQLLERSTRTHFQKVQRLWESFAQMSPR